MAEWASPSAFPLKVKCIKNTLKKNKKIIEKNNMEYN
jgi:hypothetical protein